MKRTAAALALPVAVRSALEELPLEMLEAILRALRGKNLKDVAVASSVLAGSVTRLAVARFREHLRVAPRQLEAWDARQAFPQPGQLFLSVVPPELRGVFSRDWFLRHGALPERFYWLGRALGDFETEGANVVFTGLDDLTAADVSAACMIMNTTQNGQESNLVPIIVAHLLVTRLNIDVGQLADLRANPDFARHRGFGFQDPPVCSLLWHLWDAWNANPAPPRLLATAVAEYRGSFTYGELNRFKSSIDMATTHQLMDALERVA